MSADLKLALRAIAAGERLVAIWRKHTRRGEWVPIEILQRVALLADVARAALWSAEQKARRGGA